MKIGVYGAGMIVNDFLSMYKQVEGLELAYICATPGEEEKLKELCTKYDIPKYYLDAEEAMNDETETVYLGVPNHVHYPMAKKALLLGKNVICEKPFTSNYTEAQELAELARSKGLILVEAVSTHYMPNMEAIKEMIPTLGDVKLIMMNFSKYSSRYGAFKSGMTLPAFDPAKSGGALMDINIYNLNFIVGLFGEPESIQYYPNIEKGIDTSGILILDYKNFKAVLLGAKDCEAPLAVSIEGDKRFITMDNPVNLFTSFRITDVVGYGKKHEIDDVINRNDPDKHRMYYEFVEFQRMIEEKDLKAADKALDRTLSVMKLATKARLEAGVVFTADR